MVLVDAATGQAICDNRAQQQMVNAKAMVALPCARLKIPKRPHPALRIMGGQRVGPALAKQRAIGCDAFRLAQGIVQHCAGCPDIMRVRNDIIIAGQYRWYLRRQQFGRAGI